MNFFLIMLACLFSVITMAGEIVLNMPFDSNSGIKDLSSFNNSGVLIGKANLAGNALVLDGKKSYLNCGNNKSLEIGTNDLTIVAKFKLDSSQPVYSGIVSKGAGASTDAGYSFMYRLPKKSFFFYVSDGTKRIGVQSNSDSLNDSCWHSVAVSFARGQSITFALDGKIRGIRKVEKLPSGNIINSDHDLLIGSWLKDHCLNGGIRDVRIYKQAFDEKELKEMTTLSRADGYVPGMKELPFIETAPTPIATDKEDKQGCIIFSRPITEPVYRTTKPQSDEKIKQLSAFATPGEYEPLTFSVYSLRNMRNLKVEVSDLKLKNKSATISKDNIDIRVATYYKMHFPLCTSATTYREVAELLEIIPENSFSKKECQRYWITVKVPENSPSGIYTGVVNIGDDDSFEKILLPLTFRVLNYKLKQDPNKRFSIYYYPPHKILNEYKGALKIKALTADLENMRRYGLDMYPTIYVRDADAERFYFRDNALVLEKAMELGFKGPVPIVSTISSFYKKYVPGGVIGSHFKCSKYPENDEMYVALEKAVRSFIAECKAKGYPEMIFCPIDEPRSQSAEFSAKVYAAFRRGGAKTFITNDPTSGYSHFYYKYNSIDAWCSQAFAQPYKKVIADKNHEYWAYPNHNACEIKNRVVMQKGGRMTYGFGLWRSGYSTLIPWAWRWYPGKQFDYLAHNRVSGGGNRLTENAEFVPAIYWECFREGYDDGRYLYTLEQTIEERRDSIDPQCKILIEQGDALLNEIWGRIVPEKKYLKVDFLEDKSFNTIRWRIAKLTTSLLKYPVARKSVVSPSVIATVNTEYSLLKDENYFLENGIAENIIIKTDLSKSKFNGWHATKDKELSLSVEENTDNNSIMNFNVNINHKVDGLHGGAKYPVGWPYIYFNLNTNNVQVKDPDYFYCEIKFTSTRIDQQNDVTQLVFIFTPKEGKSYNKVIDLGGVEGEWQTIRISLSAIKLGNIKTIKVLVSEERFPDQSQMNFTIANIGFLNFSKPLITAIKSVDTVLNTAENIVVKASVRGIDSNTEDKYKYGIELIDKYAAVKSVTSMQYTTDFRAVLPISNLAVGEYHLILNIYDKNNVLISTARKDISVILGYSL